MRTGRTRLSLVYAALYHSAPARLHKLRNGEPPSCTGPLLHHRRDYSSRSGTNITAPLCIYGCAFQCAHARHLSIAYISRSVCTVCSTRRIHRIYANTTHELIDIYTNRCTTSHARINYPVFFKRQKKKVACVHSSHGTQVGCTLIPHIQIEQHINIYN